MSSYPLIRGVYKVFLFFSVSGTFLFFLSCTKPEEQPLMVYPGYSSRLIFREDFDKDLSKWFVEGMGEVEITDDSCLRVAENSENDGVAIWIRQDFPENYQLEYEVEIQETAGINVVILCAQGRHGEDILTRLSPRTGKLKEYTEGEICSYHIDYHCYSPDVRQNLRSTVRKNPGYLLFSQVDPDPCRDNRKYLIDIIKIGSRIQFFVDGALIHDVRDKGGFGPVYTKGKIGFWVNGFEDVFTTFFDKVRVFKLSLE